MCVKLVAVVLVLEPSPKFQDRLVMVPVELSVKFSVSGATPLTGLPKKPATTGVIPTPETAFVELPPAANKKTTLLLKAASNPGANRIPMLVELWPGTLNALDPTMLKGPLPTLASALLATTSPRFVTMKLACALLPTATMPKSRPGGETASRAGASPVPLSALVALPPLLLNSAWALKLPGCVGVKATCTSPVWPISTLKLPAPGSTTLKGKATV